MRIESETADKLIEVLLFSGLDATPDFKPRPQSLVVESVTRSRVLSLLRLFYLKRSFFDIDSTIELVQTLLLDDFIIEEQEEEHYVLVQRIMQILS